MASETRDHNDANELLSVDPDGGGSGAPLPLVYDKNGNLREQRTVNVGSNGYRKYVYTHDAWDRLVKVQYIIKPDGQSEQSPITILAAQYNGLSWRTVKDADTSLSHNGLDERRVMIYSAGWRLLEERIDTNWSSGFTADKTIQTIYGIRYLDDVICRRTDTDNDGDYTEATDKTFYHLTDNQFSTVAVLDDVGALIERVQWDPFGRGRHQWPADVDGDGDQDSSDSTAISNLASGGGTAITSANYNVDCDINRDGVIDSTDSSLYGGALTALAKGKITSTDVGNVFGFSGYVFNAEPFGGQGGGIYTVRFRHYDSGLGRWLERDDEGGIRPQVRWPEPADAHRDLVPRIRVIPIVVQIVPAADHIIGCGITGPRMWMAIGTSPPLALDPFGLDRFDGPEHVQRSRR